MLRQGDFKLITFGDMQFEPNFKPQLFNLKDDPNELHDIAADNANKVKAMSALLAQEYDIQAADKGAKIFKTKCAQCHAAQGQGQIGPNLTDNYWIHGGKPIAIYKTINEGGRPGTGMKAWGKELDPTTVRQLAAYVTTLVGTNPPNPKEPQGGPKDPPKQIGLRPRVLLEWSWKGGAP